jgi:hypothetical protein
MASEYVLMTDFVVLPDLIRAYATESPSHPAVIVGNEIGWVDLRRPKFGRVLEVFGLARAPAVTSRRQKALRHFSQLGALNLCAVGPWRRREGLESDAARWSLESREVFGAMLAQRRLVERDARA